MWGRNRRPAVAGYFYPSDRKELIRMIEELFKSKLGPGSLPRFVMEGPREIIGLISPHAGYVYSGAIACHGYYRLAEDGLPSLIILIGPNHTGYGSAISVYPGGVWETPLGSVEVDSEFAKELHKADPYIDLEESAHTHEHCLEVQLPFLQYIAQRVGKSFKIVPIIMLQQTPSSVEILTNALRKVLSSYERREYLIIASSDFTHYEPAEIARKKDMEAISEILNFNADRFMEKVYELDISICGYGAIATLLKLSKHLGASKIELLKYGNSGDITGDYSGVVSYASFIIK